MKNNKKILFSLIALISAQVWANCPIPHQQPELRMEQNDIQQYLWEFENAGLWLEEAQEPIDATIKGYHGFIARRATLDQIALLKRQQAIYRNAGMPKEVKRFQAIIDGHAGNIHRASCLDQLLISEQFQRVSYVDSPTEFQGYIFEKNDRLKVYVAWRTAASYMGPNVGLGHAAIRRLTQQGWQFEYGIHNHPFSFDNRSGDIAGTVIPSNPDINSYLKMFDQVDLQHARITNGIHSASYQQGDLQYLSDL
ncbi:hypothetical protein [Algicola sagamiensis]|uniref:hypothetical protein n=1 Tax=Algicola sagamiensis TaxID=163869 RepID=UPI0003738D7B|nr:hypothetical protein [Algicola sagamiensis]